MHKEEFDEFLNRYLQGETSPQEEKWLDSFFQSYQKGHIPWEISRSQQTKLEILSKIRQRIEQENYNAHQPRKLWRLWLRVAAVVVIIAGLGWIMFGYLSMSDQPTLLTQTNLRGQKSAIVLSDGTRVRLNAESSLTYPEVFEDTMREVTLTGEGFFEVARNPDKPFIVHTSEFSTTVLGTAFNISTYQEKLPSVTVQEGKVKVMLSQDTAMAVFLTANQQAILSDQEFLTQEVNINQFIGWKEGVIYLNHSTLEETAHILERWYGVTILFDHPDLKNCTISGKFNNDQLINILKSIQFVKKIEFTFQDKQTIVLKGKPC